MADKFTAKLGLIVTNTINRCKKLAL